MPTMMVAHRALVTRIASLSILVMCSACTQPDPPTVTPAPAGSTIGDQGAGGPVFEVTIPPPMPAEPMPVDVRDLEPYSAPNGEFSVAIPRGWTPSMQPAGDPGSNVVVGVVFQSPEGDGLVTVTQFDNGERPLSLGFTVNNVLSDVTGWTSQPGYTEFSRETVLGRENDALRVEIGYVRSNGVPMHSLVLFVIDNTVFSMVNVAVEESSWAGNQGTIRDILSSYRVPAARTP